MLPGAGRPAGPGGIWYARLTTPAPDGASVLALANDRRPDGTIETLAPSDEALQSGCYLRASCDSEGRVVRLAATDERWPPAWFVEVRESAADPPAVNLLAFAGLGQQPGRLLDGPAAAELAVTSEDQLGAIRWWPATGEVDQVYVAPRLRRQRMGTALVLTAGCLAIARSWPRLWSDGQRTELGQAFVEGSAFRHRAQELLHVLAPMTPPDRAG